MVRSLSLLFLLALGLSTQTLAHTGVPSEPSGLHPIFHGDELVGGYTSKGYVHFPSNAATPTWRRAPATTGMYVAAYGTPAGRSFALTSAGLWEVSDGGCTYTEAETQFGPMTLVQSAFNPTGNYLSWIGATASNGKPILYHSLDGESWNRILSLPAGLGWRGCSGKQISLQDSRSSEPESTFSTYRSRKMERLNPKKPSHQAYPSKRCYSLRMRLIRCFTFERLESSMTGRHYGAVTERRQAARLSTTRLTNFSTPSGYRIPKPLHGWMNLGAEDSLELDGSLRSDLESVGYFDFLPNLGNESWFMKKTPAEHAFSRLNALGEELDWLEI